MINLAPQEQATEPVAHIALQPICDQNYRHWGDAVLYRHSSTADSANIINPVQATASTVLLAIYEIGIRQLVGKKDLLIKAPLAWLTDSNLLPAPDEQVLLEIDGSERPDAATLNSLSASGHRLSLCCEDWPTAADCQAFDTIKIPADRVQSCTSQLNALREACPTQTFIAHRVASDAQFAICREAGFDGFQGHFYARPITLSKSSQKSDSNRRILVRILQELHQSEPDLQKLTALLTQLPQAVLLLLRRVNSANFSGIRQIKNLQEALTRLGLTDIKTLIASLLITDTGKQADLLLPDILTKAALCRSIARDQPALNADTAFSVGLLAQLPGVLGIPVNTMLEQMRLCKEIEQALVERAGSYGGLLRLSEAYERAHLPQQNKALIARINQYYLEARAWTQAVLNVL